MANVIKEYTGEQIILASNQLLFNARKNNIEILAGNTIHFAANKTIQLDVGPNDSKNEEHYFIVNAPKIKLGLKTKGRTVEPIAKADSLVKSLNDLMKAVEEYSDLVSASVPPFAPLLKVAGIALKSKLAPIKTYINTPGNIKSEVSTTI